MGSLFKQLDITGFLFNYHPEFNVEISRPKAKFNTGASR